MNDDHPAMGGDAADQLRAYVHRIDDTAVQIEVLNDVKRDLYREAAACGFCKRTLRALVTIRYKKRHNPEKGELLDMYKTIMASTPVEK